MDKSQIKEQFLSYQESAQQVLSKKQVFMLAVLICLFMYGWFYRPDRAFVYVNFAVMLFYLVFMFYKVAIILRSGEKEGMVRVTAEEISQFTDEQIPVYTILIPLYKETEVLQQIVESIEKMDYPIEKMDIKLLLEEDDTETIEACRKMNLHPSFSMVIVPDGIPKTKPRACNVGLSLAKGRYTVIFDVEDIPEPDQLKKSVVGFSKSPENVVCLQAKLNFYNQRQNLLTRWFTLEYSMWFDLYLPSLGLIDAPIPLGGTSNHFVTEKIKELGGWDAYNVTEDCDLGIRIYRSGYRTLMLDSTTWEEACSNLRYWLPQRSRWVKGHIQTYLVHLKHPVLLLRQIGLKRVMHFHLLIGGMFFSLLINPVYWIFLAIWVLTRWDIMAVFFPPVVFAMGTVCLFLGNFAFIYTVSVGAAHRGYYDLVKYAFLIPPYWVLMSIGAWRGFIQLLVNPFYWDKTKHGFFRSGGHNG
jgi:glycosyltransferase XagB